MHNRHEFAIYYSQLSSIQTVPHASITLTDHEVIARVVNVLRLRVGETFILFDEQRSVSCAIDTITKKELRCTILSIHIQALLKPAVTVILPLLKKDDFEAALYSLVELGATTIQLVTTEKTQRSWGGNKEYDRCQRIMIAAAEQSKNFMMPDLKTPCTVSSYIAAISQDKSLKVYFDPQGMSVRKLVSKPAQSYILMVGPEGDLTLAEKEMLQAQGFNFCALTPTVLRSVQAIALGIGLIRSFSR